MIWFILYFFLVAYILFQDKISEKENKKIFILLIIVLCVLAGTRNVQVIKTWPGADDGIYYELYNRTPLLNRVFKEYYSENSSLAVYEIGYIVICSILKTIGLSYYGAIIVFSLIMYISIYKGFKKYIPDYSLFILTLLYKLFVYYTMVAMRQSIAMAVFFLSIRYIEERKPLKYFSLCILAISFHNGALCLLLVYFITYIPLDKNMYLKINLIMLFTLIFRIAHINIFSIFENILNSMSFINKNKVDNISSGSEMISWLHTIEYYVIVILVYTHYDRIIQKEKYCEFILKLSLAITPVFTIFSQYALFTRIKDYFSLLYGILFGYILGCYDFKIRLPVRIIFSTWLIYGFFNYILKFAWGNYFTMYYSNIINFLTLKISLVWR